MTKDEALKLALKALEVATTPLAKDRQEVLRAIIAIREALAQPEYASEADTEELLKLNELPEPLRLAAMLEKTMQWPLHGKAADCLRKMHAALEQSAQPEQEPVAYASDIEFDEETAIIPAEKKGSLGTAGLNIPLYIAPQSKVLGDAYMAGFNMGQKAAEILPPQRKPLTDEQIGALLGPFPKYASEWGYGDFYQFARAIEAAHGIKENT